MNNWRRKTLGEFISLQRGYDLTAEERETGDIPIMGAAGENGFHSKALAHAPGIIVGRSGGSFGQVHLVMKDFWPHNTAMFVTDFKGNDPFFAYYLLKNLNFSQFNSGSAQPSLNRNFIYPIKINVPVYPEEQRKISSVLRSIDTKIELNNRIKAELEPMAKTLYDYWFVQFDFPFDFAQGKPDVNGKPYKTSGGKMVYNPILKREIPEGWGATTIGKIATTALGGTPSTEVDDYWENADISWLSSAETASFPVISSDQKITQKGIENSAAILLPKGTVVISIVRYIRPSILGIDAATNQSVVGIKECPRLKSSFIYPYFCSEVPRLMGLRTGAQQPHINKGVIDESPIVLPTDYVLEEYYKKVDPIYGQIMTLAFENYKLIELRDWLLPMLMNGQVMVKQ